MTTPALETNGLTRFQPPNRLACNSSRTLQSHQDNQPRRQFRRRNPQLTPDISVVRPLAYYPNGMIDFDSLVVIRPCLSDIDLYELKSPPLWYQMGKD